MKYRSASGTVFDGFNILFMAFMIFITAYPMYFCVVASISDPVKLALNPGFLLAPFRPLTLGAYQKVLNHSLFLSGARNTLFVLVTGTVLNMILTILTGYALSRKGVLLSTPLTFFIIFTMYFSGGLVPGYLNVRDLGMINSLWALIWPGAISTYNMVIMKTAFAAVPDSLTESAQIDGARHLTVLLHIMVPLCVPTLAVLVLYYSVGHWNSWFSASI